MPSIRPATPADSLAVQSLLAEVRALFGETVTARPVPQGLDLLLAEDDGTAVGIASVAVAASSQEGGRFAWIDDVYVRPAHRGRGIGSALVDAALRHARARGAAEVRLAAPMGDASLAALYKRAGFRSPGQALMIRLLGDDEARGARG